MASEENLKPQKRGFKRQPVLSYPVGRRQLERKLALFQARRRGDDYRTSQI